MSVSSNTKDILLSNLYYSSNSQFTSIKALHDAVKNKGITINDVKEFINKQESHQIFKKPTRIRHYFPIVAKYKFEILQIDLIDMSNLSRANHGYKYLITAVDVFSRYAFIIPIKNKEANTIIDAIKYFIEKTSPRIVSTDLGSEFISDAFRKLMSRQGTDINYVDVGDHKKLGIVDRFVRTLRQKINMYMEQHNTSNYIDVLNNIVYNYNHAYHTGIKKIPSEVKEQDEDIIKLTNQKYNKAKQEETKFYKNDKVRYIINLKAFEKRSLPHWSKTIHSVIEEFSHSYKLDNDKIYKYYELQKIDQVDKLDEKQTKEPTREQMRQQRHTERKFKQSGLDLTDVVTTKRMRKPIERLNL